MKTVGFTGAAAAALLAVALAGAAHGDEGLPKGLYVGASVGHGIFKFWSDDVEVEFCERTDGCSTDDEEIVYSVYGGFELSPRVAVEAGYTRHEALEIKGSCPDRSAYRREFSAWSVYAAAVGRPPVDIGRIRPYGKAGAYWWKSEDERACGSGAFPTIKDDDAALLVGAGIDVELTERTSLRTEWTWFTESDGVHALLGGLNFRF